MKVRSVQTFGLTSRMAVGLLLSCVALTGCQPVTPQARQQVTPQPLPVSNEGVSFDPARPTMSADQAVASDPCAARLQDLSGALLFYIAINKQLPAHLEDLQSMADVDTQLQYTCPVSGKPYLYIQGGLHAPAQPKQIVVADAAPSHNGKRWCVLMGKLEKGHASAMEVLEVPESVFRTYLPVDGK